MALLMRDLTDPEVEAAVTKDGLRSFPIAWDGVAVIVNPASPIEHLSRTELKSLAGLLRKARSVHEPSGSVWK